MYEIVEKKLNELAIEFQIVEHKPALTTEQADKFIEGISGVRTKTMFLTNKKKTAFYLVIMDDSKRLDMDVFKEIVGEKQIKMASSATLDEKRMSFHPNTNEKTIFISTNDLRSFLDNIGYEANIVEL